MDHLSDNDHGTKLESWEWGREDDRVSTWMMFHFSYWRSQWSQIVFVWEKTSVMKVSKSKIAKKNKKMWRTVRTFSHQSKRGNQKTNEPALKDHIVPLLYKAKNIGHYYTIIYNGMILNNLYSIVPNCVMLVQRWAVGRREASWLLPFVSSEKIRYLFFIVKCF